MSCLNKSSLTWRTLLSQVFVLHFNQHLNMPWSRRRKTNENWFKRFKKMAISTLVDSDICSLTINDVIHTNRHLSPQHNVKMLAEVRRGNSSLFHARETIKLVLSLHNNWRGILISISEAPSTPSFYKHTTESHCLYILQPVSEDWKDQDPTLWSYNMWFYLYRQLLTASRLDLESMH